MGGSRTACSLLAPLTWHILPFPVMQWAKAWPPSVKPAAAETSVQKSCSTEKCMMPFQ